MALTPSSVLREDDTTGTSIATQQGAGGEEYQSVAIVDNSENVTGITTNPLSAQLRESGGTELSTAANPVRVGFYSGGIEVGLSDKPVFVDTSGVAITWSDSSALENEHQVHTGVGRALEVRVILDPSVTSDRYLHVFDRSTALAGGETPLHRAFIPAGGEASESFARPYATGFRVAVSTTLLTYTAPAGAEAVFHAAYRS